MILHRIGRAIARWYRPWEVHADADRARELYQRYVESLG